MNFLNRKRLPDLEIKGLPEERMGEGIASEFGMGGHSPLCWKWIADKDLLYNTRNLVFRGSLDGRGVWGRMDTCIRVAESLHRDSAEITTLLIDYVCAC